jgi:glucose-1-phosphate adenylyltransferase
MDRVLAIIMAGGAGERLQPLTRQRSKASVPFAGKYRLIDVTLSNCINSGVRRIFILTQYLSESLNRHIQDGWSISSSGLGDFIYCMPAQQKMGIDWYRGTADAVRQNLNLLRGRGVEDILILSGDHVYKMDYGKFLEFHHLKNAGLTISAVRAKKEEAAANLGVLQVDEYMRLIGFEEKPLKPKTIPENPDYCLASMGIYAFRVDVLLKVLESDGMDFGKHIIPGMASGRRDVFIYDFERQNKIQDYEIKVEYGVREKILADATRDSTFWRDVGTIDSYFESSMDLVGVDPIFSLYGEKWPLRTLQRQLPPTKCILGGRISDSIVSDGCIISGGLVDRSILSPCVIVERDAVVEQSVVFDDSSIEPGARIKKAIIDKECVVHAGASIGYDHIADTARGFKVSHSGVVVVPKGTVVGRTEPVLF